MGFIGENLLILSYISFFLATALRSSIFLSCLSFFGVISYFSYSKSSLLISTSKVFNGEILSSCYLIYLKRSSYLVVSSSSFSIGFIFSSSFSSSLMRISSVFALKKKFSSFVLLSLLNSFLSLSQSHY